VHGVQEVPLAGAAVGSLLDRQSEHVPRHHRVKFATAELVWFHPKKDRARG
jgi:hypothetical protein